MAAKRTARRKVAETTERLRAWSYSRLRDWESCPKKVYYKYIERLPGDDANAAMRRGADIHKAAEDYLAAKRAPSLDPRLEFFADDFRLLRKKKAQPEVKLALDSRWRPVEWFAPDAWCRAMADAIFFENRGRVGVVIDFKTGRVQAWHDEQLDLYALAVMLTYPRVESVVASLWYTDHAEALDGEYDRDQADDMRGVWEARVEPMMSDDRFDPTPSKQACRWCPYGASKGGPCNEEVR